jgi:hypothetical protein
MVFFFSTEATAQQLLRRPAGVEAGAVITA